MSNEKAECKCAQVLYKTEIFSEHLHSFDICSQENCGTKFLVFDDSN